MKHLRINVVGTSGSGKSTFARQLADKLGCPHVELDQLYWEPNWEGASEEVLFERIEKALTGDRWVVDGNYSRTEPVKWKNATHVVWLDHSFPRTFWQATKRAIERIRSGKEIWPGTGNVETIRRTFFSHDSILLWTITSFSGVRKKYMAKMDDPAWSQIEFVRLRNPTEAKQFLDSIEAEMHEK